MKFRENTEKLEVGRSGIDEEIEKMIKKINEGIIRKKRGKTGMGGRNGEMGNVKRRKKK